MKLHSLSFAVALVITALGSAQVINGGFEAGLSGWDTIGDTLAINNTLHSGPTEGLQQAFLATATDGTVNSDITAGSGVSASNLESFAGIIESDLAALNGGSSGHVVIGSAIAQKFHIDASKQLLFDWDFMTNQAAPGFYGPDAANNDFGFVLLQPVSSGPNNLKLADTFATFSITDPANPFISETGFRTSSFAITSADTYRLVFGVASMTTNPSGPNGVNSALLVDNVRVVPEPTSMVALCGGIAALVRRKRGQQS